MPPRTTIELRAALPRVARALRDHPAICWTAAAAIVAAIEESYARGVTDEFLEPICVEGAPGLGAGDRNHRLQDRGNLVVASRGDSALVFARDLPTTLFYATAIVFIIYIRD